MDKSNEWQTFFDGYAHKYMEEVFTKNTANEILFLQEELGLSKGSTILEVGCGTGRHSVGLAKLGYEISGVDISAAMLAEAHKGAEKAGVTIDFVHASIMDFVPQKTYDAAICLCEGALCLLGSGDDPYTRDEQVLKKVREALKPGGKFIVNALNACRLIRSYNDEQVSSGEFDLVTSTQHSDEEVDTPSGKQMISVIERVYTPSEFVGVMLRAGFVIDQVWGGTAGAWNRKTISLDEYEIMVVAHK